MKNLVLYLTINYPTRAVFFEMLDVVAAFGIGYVEIGIPVEEPHLDGAVVRQTQEKIFPDLTKAEIVSVLAEIRSRYSFNVILMTYQSGVDSFQLDQLSQELYDAILCVDQTFDGKFAGKLVHTFTTAMGEKEVEAQLAQSSQFIYLVSGKGKTGEFTQLPTDYLKLLPYVKRRSELPTFVGFGVKTPDDVAEILANGADGAIIGSEFIKQFNEGGITGIKEYLSELQPIFQNGLASK
ncbi:tryptophan synthase subunit alpha [Enterococcus sp. AZ196]|uniref:tryptophan synthase subunit alpha n=1 Tax=Enterococcus sp. AZ196 TaxID=2774659 RepID=UPI003D299602